MILPNLARPKPCYRLSETQKNLVKKINQNLFKENWKLTPINCFCSNESSEQDFLVANTDRFGNKITTLLCSKCGTLRTSPYYRDEDIIQFYQEIYRPMYTQSKLSKNKFFKDQSKRGLEIFDFIKDSINQDFKILEIGCGAGGILHPFQEKGFHVLGIDYEREYIEFGKTKNLNLEQKDLAEIEDCSLDLIILNHVLEHSREPEKMLQLIHQKLKKNGMLYIGLPGLFYIPIDYDNNIHYYLQNAHCWSFTLASTNYLLNKNSFQLIKGNEKIMALYKKTENEPFLNKHNNQFHTNLHFIKDTDNAHRNNQKIKYLLKKLLKKLILK